MEDDQYELSMALCFQRLQVSKFRLAVFMKTTPQQISAGTFSISRSEFGVQFTVQKDEKFSECKCPPPWVTLMTVRRGEGQVGETECKGTLSSFVFSYA